MGSKDGWVGGLKGLKLCRSCCSPETDIVRKGGGERVRDTGREGKREGGSKRGSKGPRERE